MKEIKPSAIILGGTNPHKELILNLKNRGYYTILIDYNESPPAKVVADEHIKESTLDKEIVLEIAKKRKVKLVLAICIDQANVTASYVSGKLGLPTPYKYGTAIAASNKILMKEKMIENDIPTSRFIVISDSKNISMDNLQFPVVVKPADSTGSKGVKKIMNTNSLNGAVINAISFSRTKKAIIEEFVEGEEVQIDCFIENSNISILMLNSKNKLQLHHDLELQSIGSYMPVIVSTNAYKTIENITQKLVEAFAFNNTPFFIQTIIKNDKVSVIEFAPRIGGGLSYKIIPKVCGVNTLNHAIDFYEGKLNKIKVKKTYSKYSTNNIYTKQGVFGSITGYKELLREGIINDFYIYKTKGTKIGKELSSNNRVAAFIVKAKDEKERLENMIRAYNNLKISDINENDLPLKKLYKND